MSTLSKLSPLIALLLLLYAVHSQAEVVLDGTLGSTVALEGPHFDINAELGQQYGGNLFHSFKWFNLNKEETATFSGPQGIENIITRITGGEHSIIDGQLISNIPQANLYLLNPDGFIFGPNVELDLQGSLYISTANKIHLGDAGTFETRHLQNSLLLSAPPSAFGFLDKPAPIEIKGSQLATRDHQTLSILGGEIHINSGHLIATSGRINLAAITKANHLKSTSTGLELDANAQLGKIVLENNSSIDVGKLGAGDIYIHGGQFFLDSSSIIANTEIDKSVIGIDVNELHMNDADIDSRAFGPGQGGQINISVARKTTLEGGSKIQSSSMSSDPQAGDAGNIFLTSQELHMNDANIDSRTFGPGQGGQINISVAEKITLEGGSNIQTTSMSSAPQAGDAGNIFLTSQYLELLNSNINTVTLGPGHGGNITLEVAHYLNLIGSADFPAAIAASSIPKIERINAGDAGRIFIRARNLSLTNTASIDNSSTGTGQGGSIILDIRDNLCLNNTASISADSLGLGNAGNIYVNTTTLSMDRGTISTATDNADGGNIIINVHTRFLMNNSLLSATVQGGIGNGGNLAIGSPRFFSLTDSKVIANASGGQGGNILIITGTPKDLQGSLITASSDTGLEGKVQINNIYNVDLNTLPISFLDANTIIKQHCSPQTDDTPSSNFFIKGRGGLPNAPDDLQTYLPHGK